MLAVLLPFLVLFGGSAHAASVHSPYTIGTWPGFRQAAISYTFDDSCPNQFAIALPMFDAAGLKMTLFSVMDSEHAMFGGWESLRRAARSGHEIASHTMSHPSLAELPPREQQIELAESRRVIAAGIRRQPALTFAYPYCAVGEEALVAEHYIAARICSGQVEGPTPKNFMQISSLIVGDLGSVNTLAHFEASAEVAAEQNGWAVYLLHGIDDDGGYSPIDSRVLQASVNYFAARRETYWVATFADAARYIRQRDAVTVREITTGEAQIELELTDGLDDTIYRLPLTLRRPLPEGWAGATVRQAGKPVKAELVGGEGKRLLQFDAVPDQGAVSIARIEG